MAGVGVNPFGRQIGLRPDARADRENDEWKKRSELFQAGNHLHKSDCGGALYPMIDARMQTKVKRNRIAPARLKTGQF
jgi:hypothetical protein